MASLLAVRGATAALRAAAASRRALSSAADRATILASGDDAALRDVVGATDFFAALEDDAPLAAAFAARLEADARVSRLETAGEVGGGEPGQPALTTYAAHLFDDEPFVVATLGSAVWPDGGDAPGAAMLFRQEARFRAVPAAVRSRLAATAAAELYEFGASEVAGVAALEGLSAWIRDAAAWEALEEPGAGAVEAVAKNRPRPGHSVLGQGTFRDAEADWTALALGYARNAGGECGAFRDAGAVLRGINYMHDASEGGLLEAGGSTATWHFEKAE